MDNCYLCGRSPATLPLDLKDSFTAHNAAKCPESDKLCQRCEQSLNFRAQYWNADKGKYSLLYARGWSWLFQGETLLCPTFKGEHEGYPIVEKMPTRAEMKEWLLNPPEPPFTICITESAQKHILFMAQEGYSRSLFPVQFELDTVWVRATEIQKDMAVFESLIGLGASKASIVSGEYHPQFLLTAIADPRFEEWEEAIARHRGTRYLDLIAHVAQRTEPIPATKPVVKTQSPKPTDNKGMQQLSLFC